MILAFTHLGWKKQKPLIEFPKEYRGNMFKLHEKYIDYLRENKEKVTRQYVISFINALHPAQLMYVINQPLRQQNVDNKNLLRMLGFEETNIMHSEPLRYRAKKSDIHFHGTSDGTIPYNGNLEWNSVQSTLDYWIDFNNTNIDPTIRSDIDLDIVGIFNV